MEWKLIEVGKNVKYLTTSRTIARVYIEVLTLLTLSTWQGRLLGFGPDLESQWGGVATWEFRFLIEQLFLFWPRISGNSFSFTFTCLIFLLLHLWSCLSQFFYFQFHILYPPSPPPPSSYFLAAGFNGPNTASKALTPSHLLQIACRQWKLQC